MNARYQDWLGTRAEARRQRLSDAAGDRGPRPVADRDHPPAETVERFVAAAPERAVARPPQPPPPDDASWHGTPVSARIIGGSALGAAGFLVAALILPVAFLAAMENPDTETLLYLLAPAAVVGLFVVGGFFALAQATRVRDRESRELEEARRVGEVLRQERSSRA